jgi:hypothetical protein
MGPQLKDIDVREAIHRQLLRHARACPDTLVIDELGLAHGACRVDIAVINGHIRGVEIKAEADDLSRLPRQIAAYGNVVDFATLVVADCHLAQAFDLLPQWWGVVSSKRSGTGAVSFSRHRPERYNRSVDPMTIARLLWRPEVVDLLRARGYGEVALRAPRGVIRTPRRRNASSPALPDRSRNA